MTLVEPVVVSIRIEASAARVYELVADASRMGQFSPEALGARGAQRRPEVGHRFIGVNRRGPVLWFTVCTVTVADPGRALEFLVDVGPVPVSRWRYDIRTTEDGVELIETWWDRRTGITGLPIKLLGQAVIPGSRPEHNRRNMQITLERMKAALEA